MRAKIRATFAVILTVCMACCVSACGDTKVQPTWSVGYTIDEGVETHTTAQANYLAGDYSKITTYAKGTEELSRPLPVHFEWMPQDGATSYELTVGTDPNFKDGISYTATEPEIDVYNLMVATDYFWRVKAKLGNGKYTLSKTTAFSTVSSAPRNIYIDGITNVRDLGGWEREDGTRVKQGMIFRCGRLNESRTETVTIEITDKGIVEMLDVLDVRTEVDLRVPDKKIGNVEYNVETGGITSSPLGEDVQYINIPIEWVMGDSFNYLTDSKNYDAIKEMFEVLADKNNYPIIYHCDIGTDRTGLFAFLVNGLMGVSEEDLYRDYLFSNFGKIGSARSVNNIKEYVNKAKSYSGATLAEKIENCLLDIGVKSEHIAAVREIMTDDR